MASSATDNRVQLTAQAGTSIKASRFCKYLNVLLYRKDLSDRDVLPVVCLSPIRGLRRKESLRCPSRRKDTSVILLSDRSCFYRAVYWKWMSGRTSA